MPAGALPNVAQAKIDVALSQFSLGYRNNALVGELLFPRVSVARQSDKYYKFGREVQILAAGTLRAAGAAAQRVDLTVSTDSYFCDDHALSAVIPDEERSNYMAGDIEQDKTKLLTANLLLDEEKEIADFAADTTNYAAGNSVTLAGASQWSRLREQRSDRRHRDGEARRSSSPASCRTWRSWERTP
jgi:hypothetical protein